MTVPDRDRVILDAAASALHRLTCVLCPGCGGPDDTERWMAEAVVTEITPLIQADGPDQLAAAVAMLRAHDAVVDRLHKRILELAEPALRKLRALPRPAADHHARLAAGTEEG
jgi:hypothetical protein